MSDSVKERENKLIKLAVNNFYDLLPEVSNSKLKWTNFKDDLISGEELVFIEIEYDCLYPKEMIELGKFIDGLENIDCVNDLYLCGGETGTIVLGVTAYEDKIEELSDWKPKI